METILKVQDLKKIYHLKKEKITAVNGISFEGHKGEILGILGPNGSGKTTTVKSIATIVDYDEGTIEINGYNNKKYRKKILQHIGAVLEGSRNIYWRLTPVENMIYFAGLKGIGKKEIKNRIEYFLETLDLKKVANDQVRKFSKGMKQKIAVACALISDPDIVLLDEPTLGLDVETTRIMQNWIKDYAQKTNKFILITSHDMKFIENTCDRVIIIKNGQIIKNGTINELKNFFSKKVYKIVISEKPTTSEITKFETLDHFRYEENKESYSLFFTFKNPMKLYEVLDILKLNNHNIIELETMVNDFEDIFLDIIKSSS